MKKGKDKYMSASFRKVWNIDPSTKVHNDVDRVKERRGIRQKIHNIHGRIDPDDLEALEDFGLDD